MPRLYNIDVLPMGYSNIGNTRLENCNILRYNVILSGIMSNIKYLDGFQFKNYVRLVKIILRGLSIIKLRHFVENILFSIVARKINGYDTVIAYEEGACTFFTSKIKAQNKIAWIHCDYNKYLENIKCKNEYRIYKKYHKIVCVSNFTLNNFLNIYPDFKNKSVCIYNTINKDLIIRASQEKIEDIPISTDRKILLSIGRIVPVKQFSLIPEIISKITSNNFTWYLIGDIDDSSEFKILKEKLLIFNINEDKFIYLGHKDNPYPYIKCSDILISLSRSEACPYVVNEAKILKVPVISNNYPSAYEFIINGHDGIICSLEDMPTQLDMILTDKLKLNTLKSHLMTLEYNNSLIQKIIDII